MYKTFTITAHNNLDGENRNITIEALDKNHARHIAHQIVEFPEMVLHVIEKGTLHLIRYTENGEKCWDNIEAATQEQAIAELRAIEPQSPIEILSVETFDNYEEAISAAYSGELQEAQEQQEQQEQPDEISVDSLRDGLELGDYGEYVNDYRGSSAYICDMIAEIADSNTSIYYSDILHFISENPEALADVIDEGLYDPSHGYDLHQHGQAAEYMTIERDIWDHLENALYLAALDFIRYDLERETIPVELSELLYEWAADPGDRMSDIPDRIREYFHGTQEDDGE